MIVSSYTSFILCIIYQYRKQTTSFTLKVKDCSYIGKQGYKGETKCVIEFTLNKIRDQSNSRVPSKWFIVYSTLPFTCLLTEFD